MRRGPLTLELRGWNTIGEDGAEANERTVEIVKSYCAELRGGRKADHELHSLDEGGEWSSAAGKRSTEKAKEKKDWHCWDQRQRTDPEGPVGRQKLVGLGRAD